MFMHTALKSENVDLKAQVRKLSSNMGKLKSQLGCQENDAKNLKDDK
jgi:hypothetical protein